MLIYVRPISSSVNISLLIWIDVTCHLMNLVSSLGRQERCCCQLWSRNRLDSCLFSLPSYRLIKALQYQKSRLIFANLKKHRRKANDNSVRPPHCSQLSVHEYVSLMVTSAMTPCNDLCIAFENHTQGVRRLHM